MKKSLIGIVIVAIAIWIGISTYQSCNAPKPTPGSTIDVNGKTYTVIKHVHDTVKIPVTQTVFKPGTTIYVDSPIYVSVPMSVDTANIIKNYFSYKNYKDTLYLKDSLGYVSVLDTIFKNSIHSRTWNYKVNKFIVKDSIFLKEEVYKWYVGGSLGTVNSNMATFGVNVVFEDKKSTLYNVNLGFTTKFQPYIMFSLLYKVSPKK
jgi:hypothetical protein